MTLGSYEFDTKRLTGPHSLPNVLTFPLSIPVSQSFKNSLTSFGLQDPLTFGCRTSRYFVARPRSLLIDLPNLHSILPKTTSASSHISSDLLSEENFSATPGYIVMHDRWGIVLLFGSAWFTWNRSDRHVRGKSEVERIASCSARGFLSQTMNLHAQQHACQHHHARLEAYGHGTWEILMSA